MFVSSVSHDLVEARKANHLVHLLVFVFQAESQSIGLPKPQLKPLRQQQLRKLSMRPSPKKIMLLLLRTKAKLLMKRMKSLR